MDKLYPLKFKPILKDKIWGGNKLSKLLNKNTNSEKCGESWELSGVQENLSVVSEGFLAGNNIQELTEVFMGDLVGEKVFQKFGVEFPLLIKFIDANDDLSIQVHPDDEMARERHGAFGKTEMWYIVQAENEARLIAGFNRDVDPTEYMNRLEEGTLQEILNFEPVAPGDVFFMPAGRVHAIGKGILLAEIQQTSDVTYRIYDWGRVDDNGNPRDLHTELAIDAIDFKKRENYRTLYSIEKNKPSLLAECEYFKTSVLELDKNMERDYSLLDSFVIYMCVDGEVSINTEGNKEVRMIKGETLLIPAETEFVKLAPSMKARLLEIYIP